MSDETNTAVAAPPAPKTYEQVFDDPFEGTPSNSYTMEALQAELQGRADNPEPEPNEPPGVEMSVEEIMAQYAQPKPEPKQEAVEDTTETAEPEDAAFDAFMADLNELAGRALGVAAVPAPEAVAEAPAPPPEPVAVQPVAQPLPFNMDLDYDQLTDIVTEPAKFKEFLEGFAGAVRGQAVQDMMKSMYPATREAMYADRFAEEILEKYPSIEKDAGNILTLAWRRAMDRNPGSPYRKVADEALSAVNAVMSKRKNIEKSGNQRDIRGRFSPQTARTARPNPAPVRKDPTEEAFGMINSVTSGPGSDILRLFG